MLIVTQPFIGYGYDYAQPGQLIDPPEDVRRELLSIGVVADYETKVTALPEAVKKNARSGSSQAGQAARKRTRLNWQQLAKQSRSMTRTD